MRWKARAVLLIGSAIVASLVGLLALHDCCDLFAHRLCCITAVELTSASHRERACRQFGLCRDEAAVPFLVRALADLDWRVAMAAADSLEAIGERSVVPELIRMTTDPRSENGREFAVVTLGGLGDPAAVPALIAALGDPDVLVRRNAANALGRLRPSGAVGPLLAALADPAFGYRSCAALALGKIGDDRAFEPLAAFLETESDQHQASGAAEGLGHLGDRRAVPILLRFAHDPRLYVAMHAVESLGELGDPGAVDPLCALIDDRSASADVQMRAVIALGRLGDPRGLPTLLRVGGKYGHYPVFARGRLGDPSVRPQLIGLLLSDTGWLRAEAAAALGRCGTAADLPLLRAALADIEVDVRTAATQAIRAIEGRASAVDKR